MTDLISQFHFLRPHWLLLILPCLILGYLMWRQRDHHAGWSRVVSPELLAHLITNEAAQRRRTLVPALVATWCLACLAAAGPSWRQLPQPVLQKQDALVIMLDLSYSMLATDLQPSRQDRVRRKLLDLLRERREGLTAMIAYAGDAHIVAPLTDDNPTIANLLPALNPQMMPLPGSNPVEAVERALTLLDSAGVSSGRLLLVTDGIDSRDTEAIADLLADGTRQLAILGVGTEVGAPIALPDGGFLKDQDGEIVIPALDEEPLRDLASQLSGNYRRISVDDRDIDSLVNDATLLSAADDTIALDRRADQWEDMAHWFVLPILLICLMSFRRGWVYVLPLCLTLMPSEETQAFEWQDLWQTRDQQARDALRAGDSARASELFENPAWRGTAAYQEQDYDTAIDSFASGDGADSWYNRGNALASAGRLDEAIDAYERSLELQPDAEDARKNLETVKRLKEQQEQQSQSQQQQEGGEPQNQEQQQDGSEQQNNEGSQQDQQQDGQQGQNQQNDSSEQQSQEGDSSQPSEQGNNQDQEQSQDQDNGSPGDEDQSEQGQGQQERQPMPTPSIDNSKMQEDMERDQAMQQWLRRVPDDPSGLLREKFRYESRQRQQQGKRREQQKIW